MADNVQAEQVVTAGVTFATDEDTVGSRQVPWTKLMWGANGTFNELDTPNPLPINIRTSTIDVMLGTDFSAVLGTANLVATDGSAALTIGLHALGTDGTNAQILSTNTTGHLNIADGGNSITVDGTITANAGTGTFTVGDGGGSITVDAPAGTPIFVQQSDGTTAQTWAVGDMDTGAPTVNRILVGIALPGSGGSVIGGTSTNPIRTDPTGTTTQPVSGTVTSNAGTGDFLTIVGHTRNEAFKESAAIGGELDDTAPVAATEGNVSPARITAQRALHTNLRNNAGTELGTGTDPVRTDPTGTTTQPVSGTVTSNQGTAAAGSGAWPITVTNTTDTVVKPGDSVNDAVRVNIVAGGGAGGTSMTDDAAFTPGSTGITPAGGTYRSVRDLVDDNDGGAFAMTQSRALLVAMETPDGDNAMDDTNNALRVNVVAGSTAGTEYNEDDATPATIVGSATLIERDDALSTVTPIEGDWIGLRGTSRGALWVEHDTNTAIPVTKSGTWTLDANSGVDIGDVDITSVIPGTAATNLGKAEDAVHTTGDVGVMSLGVRRDADTSLVGTDGDYAPFQVNANGALKVEIFDGGDSHTVDGTVAVSSITTSVTPGTSAAHLGKSVDSVAGGTDTGIAMLAVRDDTLTTLTPADGDYTHLRVTSTGALHVNGMTITEYTVNAVVPADPKGSAGLMERDDALSTLTEVEGDWTNMRATSRGALWTTTDEPPTNRTASGTLAALNNTVVINSQGTGSVHYEIDTGLVGTVVFEGTMDDTNWFALQGMDFSGTLRLNVNSFPARGSINGGGLSQVRLRVSAFTSGSSAARLEGGAGTNLVRLADIDSSTNGLFVDVRDVKPGSSASNLGKLEDGASADGDTGVAFLAVRDDALAAGAGVGADGDYAFTRVNNNGALWTILDANSGTDIGDVDVTSVIPGTGATNLGKAIDSVSGATDTGVVLLATRDDALSALTPAEGDWVQLRVNSTGALHVTDGGTEYNEDDASPNPIVGTATLMERDDALSAVTPIEGDFIAFRGSSRGALWVQNDLVNTTASGALGALNAAVTISDEGVGSINWEIDTGTLVGTVVFEATLDDTNWFAVDAIRIDDTVITSTNTFADRGAFTSTGYSQVRLRVSAYTSGTSNARVEASIGSHVVRVGNDSITVDAPAATPVAVRVSDGSAFVDSPADNSAFTVGTDSVAPIGCLYDDTAPSAMTEDRVGLPRMSSNRVQYMQIRDAAGNERGVNVDANNELSIVVPTSITPGTAAANLGKAIDAVAGGTDTGVALLATRDDALTTLTPADGDWVQLRVNSTGALHVTGGGGGTEYNEDDATPNPIIGTATLMERDDALSALTPIEGDFAALRCDANGALWTHDDALDAALSGSELQVDIVAALPTGANTIGEVTIGAATTAAGDLAKAVDAVAGGSDVGVAILAIRDDALTTLTPIDGDYVQLRVNSTGALHVTGGGGGTEYNEDDVTPAPIVGTATLMERDDALSTVTPAEADFIAFRGTARGALWTAEDPVNIQGTGTLNAANAAATVKCEGATSINWEIDTGTLVGTVVFEATLDDTNWFAVDSIGIDGVIDTSTTTFADRGAFTSTGYSQARLRVSSFTSGSSAARIEASKGTNVVRLGDMVPAGTNNIGDVDIVSLPNEGQQTMANSISVAVASDQSVISIDDNAGNLSIDINGTVPSLNTGVRDAGTQRVTVATDDVVPVSYSSGTFVVSGTVTADAGTGDFLTVVGHTINEALKESAAVGGQLDDTATTAATENNIAPARITAQRAFHTNLRNNAGTELGTSSDPVRTDPTGTTTQPVSGTVTSNAGTGTFTSGGVAAHDVAVSGNPVRVGAKSNLNEPAAVDADADTVDLWADRLGRLVIMNGHSNPEAPNTTNLTASGDGELIAAPGAGVRLYIQKGSVHNAGSADITVAIRQGAAGTIRWQARLAANGGGSQFDFGARGWQLPLNTALTGNLGAAGDVDFNVTEYYIAA